MGSHKKGTSTLKERRVPTPPFPALRVSEAGDELVLRTRVDGGVVELHIPVSQACRPRRPRHHIPGFNPDATPC
jgi:hypothetical protein